MVGLAVAGRMNLNLFRRNDRPATLRLDTPHSRERPRLRPPHAVTMRDLEEPIPSHHRPDTHRLKQHVIARVASSATAIAAHAPPDPTTPAADPPPRPATAASTAAPNRSTITSISPSLTT